MFAVSREKKPPTVLAGDAESSLWSVQWCGMQNMGRYLFGCAFRQCRHEVVMNLNYHSILLPVGQWVINDLKNDLIEIVKIKQIWYAYRDRMRFGVVVLPGGRGI